MSAPHLDDDFRFIVQSLSLGRTLVSYGSVIGGAQHGCEYQRHDIMNLVDDYTAV